MLAHSIARTVSRSPGSAPSCAVVERQASNSAAASSSSPSMMAACRRLPWTACIEPPMKRANFFRPVSSSRSWPVLTAGLSAATGTARS
jgi:hypothetical protein